MTFQIDAWLERPDPQMRVIDTATGVVVAEFNQTEIQQLCEWGEICPQDFCSRCAETQEALVKQLLLASCARQIGQPVSEITVAPSQNSRKTAKIYLFPV
ncbi:MAG TPA: hypothetical protein EYH06_00375 [Chromatiales bacterium]|nr:hypothetical protein [Thiotrichales bacterium]HIP67026.1 hypothetical protein [Chromatiales bacterium]